MKHLKFFEGYAETVGQHGFNVVGRYTASGNTTHPYLLASENEEEINGLDIKNLKINPESTYCIPNTYYNTLLNSPFYELRGYDKVDDNISLVNDDGYSKVYRADKFDYFKFDIK